MTVVTDLDLPFFDIFDPDYGATCHERAQAVLAAGGWIVRTPIGYGVIEHDAVRELQKDPRFRAMGVTLYEMQGVTSGKLYDQFSRLILNIDGPEHTRQRKLVARAFTPRAVDRLRPMMRAYVQARASAIAERGTCELMADVAEAYPIAVICQLLGAPGEDWPKFSAWATTIFRQFSFDLANDLPEIEQAVTEVEAYLEALIEKRRGQPRDDLISDLLAAEEEGDRLTHQELMDLVTAVLLAGTDTTRNELGLAMLTFARHPDQWARVVADPSLVPAAVEEVLRFAPTIEATPRVAIDDLEYRGVTIPAGTMLALVTAFANRDPSVVQCPMDLDVGADRAGWQATTFGSGPHYCLGASLARAELQEAVGVMARTWRTVELVGEPEMKAPVGVYGPIAVHLRVEPN
jgi:cytochrome P450